MSYTSKLLALGYFLIYSMTIFTSCASIKSIRLENTFIHPEIDFTHYKKIAVLEYSDNLKGQQLFYREKNIPERLLAITLEELQREGFETVGVRKIGHKIELKKAIIDVKKGGKFECFLIDTEFKIKDLSSPQVVQFLKDKLNVSAIFWGRVEEFKVERKVTWRDYVSEIELQPGYGDTSQLQYICDISLTMEMIDVLDMKKIWSCSISCEKIKTENHEKLLINLVQKCLETVPNK